MARIITKGLALKIVKKLKAKQIKSRSKCHDEYVVEEDELQRRRAEWQPLPPRFDTGVLGKYAKLVGSAAEGAVCG